MSMRLDTLSRFLSPRLNRHYRRVFDLSSAPPRILSDEAVFRGLDRQYQDMTFRTHGEHDQARARTALMEHFRVRCHPKFFVTSSQIAELIAELPHESPCRHESLRTHARDWKAVLHNKYQPANTNDGYDWTEAPLGPGHDHLYRDRQHMLGFAPVLARAELLGCDTHDDLNSRLAYWAELNARQQTPPGYATPLLAVFRIAALSWALAFSLARSAPHRELEWLMLKIILTDADYLDRHIGCSYANNHLLADGFALWYVGTLFPEFRRSRKWIQRGADVWLRQLRIQVLPDGSSFEHSVHYHELVCEMATAYFLLSRTNEHAMPDWFPLLLSKMLAFQMALGGPEGIAPQIGDTVEDRLFPLETSLGRANASFQPLADAICRSGDELRREPDDPKFERAYWLLGERSIACRETPVDSFACFPDGGFFVMPDSRSHSRLTLRTGPTQHLPIAPGHMHDDLLSVYLHLEGRPVIVEPGTYTYRSKPENWPAGSPPWRAHFLSARSHSGPYIEGIEPLGRKERDFPSGPVASHVTTRVRASAPQLRWVESQISSTTPYHGHTRGVFHVTDEYWFIYDIVPRLLRKPISFGFQFDPDSEVSERGPKALEAKTGKCGLALVSTLSNRTLARGSLSPLDGWVSPAYGVLQPAPMVRFQPSEDECKHPIGFLLTSTLQHPQIELQQIRGGYAMRCRTDSFEDIVLLNDGSAATVQAFGCTFDGTICWVRIQHQHVIAVRWVDGQRLAVRAADFSLRYDQTVPSLNINNAEFVGISPESSGVRTD